MKTVAKVVAASLLLALARGTALAQSGYDLFQQALVKERAGGKLEQAIELYQRIVREFATDRPLAAKALVQLGQSYEKLGREEARQAYERVLRDYADQQEQVTAARARLATLAQSAGTADRPGMVVRRVWAGPDVDLNGALLPGGRYFASTDWQTGDVAVWDLTTGEKRRITNKGSWFGSDEYALGFAASPEGRQIAYGWYNKDKFFDLRTIAVEGSEPRVLYRNEEVRYVQPAAWSPDGKSILVLLSRADRTNQIALVSVANGSVRVLKTLDWRSPQKMDFSPDGRYIAYDFPLREDAPERDIFVLAADGSRETPLVQHPADDFVLGWAPDGGHLLFASDRTGTFAAWLLRVADGKPEGSPKLVRPDVSRVRPIGFARNGSFYYALNTGTRDVYVAALDVVTGKLPSPPASVVPRFVGANFDPDWSPDGMYLVYLSERTPGRRSRTVVIRSVETGEERTLSPELTRLWRPRWSPDARSILVNASDPKGRSGIYAIDAQTGVATPIIQNEPGGWSQWPVWSGDGRAVFYDHVQGGKKRILAHDVATGQERELYRGSFGNELAVSPDGGQLAFAGFDTETRSGGLKVMPTAGGAARELLRITEGEARPVALTTQALLYELRFYGDSVAHRGVELWRMPLEGGTPEKLELAMEGLAMTGVDHFRLHPDGRRIAFAAGETKEELWVMENFLPASARR